ncbi:MAG: STAS domain-containing protein [Candidatus Eisenbacteria bacterium]
MIELRPLRAPDGLVVWGRLLGTWGRRECVELLAFFTQLALPQGCRVLLDFSGLDHVHFNGAPWLIALAEGIESRGGSVQVVGLTDELLNIFELGAACEARDFIERHGFWTPLPGSADDRRAAALARGAFVSDPQGLGVVSLN